MRLAGARPRAVNALITAEGFTFRRLAERSAKKSPGIESR